MSFRRLLICVTLSLAGVAALPAQSEPDFLRALSEFEQMRTMLPRYLNARAQAMLAERRRTIAEIDTPAEVEARRAYVRKTLTEAVGGFPERTPLNARVVGVLERPDYRIEKIIFESRPNFYVTANLYVPKQGAGPYPAVLFPLGHEQGGKSHETWQRMLGSLAKKGYVALTWDPAGQGERAQLYDPDFERRKVIRSTTEHTIMGVQCLLVGDNFAQYTIWDGIRALDYLLSRPEVDSSRVALTGNSGGGTHTAYLSTLEDRIQVAAPSCYITSWERLLETIGPQDAEQVLLPWIGEGLDHGDFVLSFAPRPYLMLSAVRDFFSIRGARSTFLEAQRIYEVMDAKAKLSRSEVDRGHGYHQPNREATYDWFARWLKDSRDEGPEPDIEVAEFSELACTETGQVATSLGGETVYTLNQKRAAALKPGLPRVESAGDIAKFRQEVRERVRKVSGFEYESGAPRVETFGEFRREGYRVEKFIYHSESGVFVPSLLFVPDGGPAKKPAVVYVHGGGKSAEAGQGEEIEWFVRSGAIVLAIDPRGMGETDRVDDRNGSDFPRFFGDYEGAMTSFLIGKSLVAMRARDILKGVDLLQARDDVDASKISGIGKRGGAVPLLYAAALDDRIGKLAVEEVLLSYRSITEQSLHQNVLESIVPGALKSYDLPDLAASLVGRELRIINPVDPLGNAATPEQVRRTYARTTRIFRAAEKRDGLVVAHRKPDAGPESVYSGWLD